MRRVLRRVLIGGCLLLLGLGAAFAYFLYSPAPEVPPLSASLQRSTLRSSPFTAPWATPQIRRASAYRFDQLAEEHGFVVYPEGFEGHWNDCRKKGSFAARRGTVHVPTERPSSGVR